MTTQNMSVGPPRFSPDLLAAGFDRRPAMPTGRAGRYIHQTDTFRPRSAFRPGEVPKVARLMCRSGWG
jgi:hypothetical protein